MAIENVKAFYEALKTDTELQAKVNAADQAYNGDAADEAAAIADILLPIAKEAGFDFTVEELLEFENAAAPEGEFTEDELETVAGGAAYCFFIGIGKSKTGGTRCKHIGIGLGYGY